MKSTECNLAEKSCKPCEGGVTPLNAEEMVLFLSQLGKDWQINSSGYLWKNYIFPDFKTPIEFANKIAVAADENWHHPNLLISWGLCQVEIWTHKINGLSPSDFYLAAKIDLLLKPK